MHSPHRTDERYKSMARISTFNVLKANNLSSILFSPWLRCVRNLFIGFFFWSSWLKKLSQRSSPLSRIDLKADACHTFFNSPCLVSFIIEYSAAPEDCRWVSFQNYFANVKWNEICDPTVKYAAFETRIKHIFTPVHFSRFLTEYSSCVFPPLFLEWKVVA